MAVELWDADPNVCCAAYQLGACEHTEAWTDDEIADALAWNEDNMAPTVTTRTLASGRTVYVDQDGKVIDKPADVQTRHECDGFCNGTGIYLIRGAFINGKFVGSSGECYRCGGKGYMTDADIKRNNYYDNHVRRIYL